MSRYNHFREKTIHKTVNYYDLKKGDKFSFSDKPFKECQKISDTEYLNLKTNYLTPLFKTTGEFRVYLRELNVL